MHRPILVGLSTVLIAGALATPASAQSPPATIDIDTCVVKTSRNAANSAKPYTWAYCPIVSQAPAGQSVSVRYSANLATYDPLPKFGYRSQSGKLLLEGGGQQLLNLSFAFRNRTPAQVAKRLKVTLSSPEGATLTDSSATAARAS